MCSTNHEEIAVCTDNTDEIVCIQSDRRVQASVLSAMQTDDKFCDVLLFGVPPPGGAISTVIPIRGHKNVLAYASKHLYELFTSDSSKFGYIIENVSHDSLRLIVNYIYTDKLSTTRSFAVNVICQILSGAKVLVMPELAEACETFLAGDAQVNLNNCVFLWGFARQHTCLDLMHTTSTFIAKSIRDMPTNAHFLRMPFEDCVKLLLSEAFIAADANFRCLSAVAWLNCDAAADRACYMHDVMNTIPFTPDSTLIIPMTTNTASDAMLNLPAGTSKPVEQTLPVLKLDSWPSNQKWYVIGGKTCREMFLSYDVEQKLWSKLPSLPEKRTNLGVCAVANRLFAIGGNKNDNYGVDDVDGFNFEAKTWTSLDDVKLETCRSELAVCCDGLYAYAIGGCDVGGNSYKTTIERFDMNSNQICTLSSMNLERAAPAAVFAPSSNSIYVAGGYFFFSNCCKNIHSGIEKYDISNDKWSQVGSMVYSRYGFGAALSGDDLYCIGGFTTASTKNNYGGSDFVEIFNVRTSQTREGPDLIKKRPGCSVTTIDNGNVICVLGGCSPTVETCDVREGKWTTGIVPAMPEANMSFGFAAV